LLDIASSDNIKIESQQIQRENSRLKRPEGFRKQDFDAKISPSGRLFCFF